MFAFAFVVGLLSGVGPLIQATQDFTMSVAANDAVTGVGTQLQQVLTGGVLSVIGLVTGGMAALWLVFSLIRRAIHAH